MDFEITEKLVQKFWNKVDKTKECWDWDGTGDIRGYGYITVTNPKRIGVHRLSWMIHNGPIPANLVICHKCDSPCCVNPSHLFLGTQADNMADRVAKGRGYIRQAYVTAKLTSDQIKEIRSAYSPRKITQKILSEKYGVTRENIHYILKGKSWRHLEGINSKKDERIKLSKDEIQEILSLYKDGRGSHRSIAKRFGVSKTHITRILNQTP